MDIVTESDAAHDARGPFCHFDLASSCPKHLCSGDIPIYLQISQILDRSIHKPRRSLIGSACLFHPEDFTPNCIEHRTSVPAATRRQTHHHQRSGRTDDDFAEPRGKLSGFISALSESSRFSLFDVSSRLKGSFAQAFSSGSLFVEDDTRCQVGQGAQPFTAAAIEPATFHLKHHAMTSAVR